MSHWQAVDEELTRWQAAGRRCPVWLRDDDAVSDTPALRRLLALCENAGVPLGLAVIPANADASLAELLADHPNVSVLVHGWAHADHAAPAEKKCEFPAARPPDLRAADAARALDRLRGLFESRIGRRMVPLFVPPWNRMAPDMPDLLAAAGYRAVSAFGDRPAERHSSGLLWLNTHIDLIDWRGSRSAVPLAAVLDQLRRHLADRREGRRDPAEPVGLLSHHLVHDPAIWTLLENLLARLGRHPALDWRPPFA